MNQPNSIRRTSMDHSKKRSIVDHVLSAAVLAAFLANPAQSFADFRAGGQSSIADVPLNVVVDEATEIWGVVMSEAFGLATSSNMIVTVCSDGANPGGAVANTYRFVISLDDTSPGLNTGSERTLDDIYDDPNKDDPDFVHVCSTRFFLNVTPGAHTIQWLASKANAAMKDTTVEDTSMTLAAFGGSRL